MKAGTLLSLRLVIIMGLCPDIQLLVSFERSGARVDA